MAPKGGGGRGSSGGGSLGGSGSSIFSGSGRSSTSSGSWGFKAGLSSNICVGWCRRFIRIPIAVLFLCAFVAILIWYIRVANRRVKVKPFLEWYGYGLSLVLLMIALLLETVFFAIYQCGVYGDRWAFTLDGVEQGAHALSDLALIGVILLPVTRGIVEYSGRIFGKIRYWHWLLMGAIFVLIIVHIGLYVAVFMGTYEGPADLHVYAAFNFLNFIGSVSATICMRNAMSRIKSQGILLEAPKVALESLTYLVPLRATYGLLISIMIDLVSLGVGDVFGIVHPILRNLFDLGVFFCILSIAAKPTLANAISHMQPELPPYTEQQIPAVKPPGPNLVLPVPPMPQPHPQPPAFQPNATSPQYQYPPPPQPPAPAAQPQGQWVFVPAQTQQQTPQPSELQQPQLPPVLPQQPAAAELQPASPNPLQQGPPVWRA